MKRLVRPEPTRTKPIRSVYHHWRGSAFEAGGYTMSSDAFQNASEEREAEPDPSGTEPDSESTSVLIKKAVASAYHVIDAYIAEGRYAAGRISVGTYTNSDVETQIESLAKQWVVLAKDLSVKSIDILANIVRDTRLAPSSEPRTASSPSPGARAAAPQSAPPQIAVETRSRRPLQVHHELDTTGPYFVPQIPPIYSADRRASPLSRARIVGGAGERLVLVVEVPDEQPPGTYTGPIIDARTKEKRGQISVTVL
jgi:hypothetical protein